MTLLEYLG
jgi:hypothetical protein